VAVAACERPGDRPMGLEEIESVRLACDLCAPRLVNLHERDRWVGARAAASARRLPAAVLGSKHTWVKVAVLAVFAAVAFLSFAKGHYQADGSFVLEATRQQVVPAPFEGFLKSVFVDIDDPVTAGQTVLAELDDSELRLQLAAAKADRLAYLKRAAAAMRDRKTAEAHIARAEADKVQAQIKLLEHRIGKARMLAPMTGRVLTGDLKQRIGAPVKTGEPLFEIAPLTSLRAKLAIPEDEIAEVAKGGEGQIRALGKPGQPVGFVIERISPVARVEKEKNVFEVRVRLKGTRPWMRPGMAGDAKIHLGRRTYAWLWTRKLVNWLRMKLWW